MTEVAQPTDDLECDKSEQQPQPSSDAEMTQLIADQREAWAKAYRALVDKGVF